MKLTCGTIFLLAAVMAATPGRVNTTAAAETKELSPGGPFVDLTWSDDFGEIVAKLNKLPDIKSVNFPAQALDLTGVKSKVELYNRLKDQIDPQSLKSCVGISRKVYQPSGPQLQAHFVAYKDVPLKLVARLEASPGLIVRFPQRTLLTEKADFHIPLFLDRVDVVIDSEQGAGRAMALQYLPICRALEKHYANFVPEFGGIERDNEKSFVHNFRMEITYPKEKGAQLFTVANFTSSQDDGTLRGGFSFRVARGDSLKFRLDEEYKKHAVKVQIPDEK